MRLIALMAWYDEPIESLVASIASLELAGVDHVVALDGAYSLYPDAQPASDPNQHAAVHLACRQLGMGCTIQTVAEPWAGNEPEKRTALFALGWAVAKPGDWFMVHDADMAITRCPDDLKDRLEATDCQVATVQILDVVALRARQPDWPPYFEFCGLYRAQPIIVGPHHAQYRTPEGQHLWAGNGEESPVPALDLTDVVRVEHRPDRRSLERQQRKQAYYNLRDQERVERGDCSRCGVPAVRLVPRKWRMTQLGPVGEWAEACEPCALELEKVGRRQLRQLGVKNPDEVTFENRNGRAPAGMTAD